MSSIAPFNTKQVEYLERCKTSWFNALEGGKRGSKNVLQTTAFCQSLEFHPNRVHLIAGVSVATAKLNIIDCDGFGLTRRFAGRYKEGKYKDRDCIYVQTRTGEKIILVSGGGKRGDEKLIKGNTYGMVMITEANECTLEFLNEARDRTLSSQDRKMFHDFNPKGPTHPYYAEVLNFHEEQQKKNPLYGFNYGHTTIADNMSISDEKLKRELATYDKNTVWYLRDILGLRIASDGLVYVTFANKPDKFFTDEPDYDFITVGVDPGGNKSGHAFVATGEKHDYSKVTALASVRHKAEGTSPKDFYRQLGKFLDFVMGKYGYIDEIRFDSEAQTLLNGASELFGLGTAYDIRVNNAIKGRIRDRVDAGDSMMAQGIFYYTEDAISLKDALSTAMYNPKSKNDERLDDFTTDMDSIDAWEYTWEPRIKRYSRRVNLLDEAG